MMQDIAGAGQENSQLSMSSHAISKISRRDLKDVIGHESSALDSSMMQKRTVTEESSSSQLTNQKVTSNIDSIYGFYKKKGKGDDDDETEN